MPTNVNLSRPDMLRSNAPTPAPEPRRPSDERELIEAERVYRQGVVTVRDRLSPSQWEICPDALCCHLSSLYFRRLVRADYQLQQSARYRHVLLSGAVGCDSEAVEE